MKSTRIFAPAICIAAFLGAAATPAAAATTATPDPATPTETVTISPDGDCVQRWDALVNAGAGYGVIVVAWPDGSEDIYGTPMPNPADIAVPAGMTPGTATISVYKGLSNGEPVGLYESCAGSFEIVEDATVPTVDPMVAAGLAVGAGSGLWALKKTRKESLI